MTPGSWDIESTAILTTSEVRLVVDNLRYRAKRSPNARTNLIVFRLATCCGLRASEIAGITIGDVRLSSSKPHILVHRAVAKGGKQRQVPLWWDAGTLDDLAAWRDSRVVQDKAANSAPFVCTRARNSSGNRLHRNAVRNRFLNACKVLGEERVKALTVHSGRHTFVSHALKHRTLAEVRRAAGHSNIATTSIYLHVAVEDDGEIGRLFD